jgi:membrane protein implicated in regulation of membrane protease activity
MERWVLWVVFGIFLLILEMLTPSVFFIACFGISALVAGLLTFLGFPTWAVWGGFFALSVTLVLLARPLALRLTKGESRPSNVDQLIGKSALVIEAITPHKPGLVKVEGEEWRAEAGVDVAPQSWVRVLKVEGTRLIVEKQ